MKYIAVLEGFKLPKKQSLKIWRYMSLEKFKSMLDKKGLYFSSARQFDDSFEGSITQRHYEFNLRNSNNRRGIDTDFYKKHVSPAFYELTGLTKINCWHLSEFESAAMWQLYLRDGKGIAIQSNIGRLKKSLKPFRSKPEYGIETINLGKVRYIDYRSDRMDDKSMLGRFFYKRKSFSHERELRAAVTLRMAEESGVNIPPKGVFVDVDLNVLISCVHLAPAVNPEFKEEIIKLIQAKGYTFDVKHSEMDDEALF